MDRSILILDNDAAHAVELHGILLSDGFSEIYTLHDNLAAERWLAQHTPDIAIIDPLLRDGSCRSIVSTLRKRQIPFVVYSDLRPDCEWLSDGDWVSKPCSPHVMLSSVRFAMAVRDLRTIPD